jgi:hypothetical protein
VSIFLTAAEVTGREPQGAVGDWAAHGDFNRWMTGWNAYPQAKQVTTVTVTDQGDGDDVILTIDGVDIEFATGTGLDLAAIGAGIVAAINNEPVVRSKVVPSFSGSTLTLTGVWPGESFTVSIASDPDSVLSAVTAVVAPDEADPIPVGRALVSQGFPDGEPEERVALPVAALFDAQVITATVVNGVATARNVRVWMDGVLVVDTVYTGNATEATEAAAIATAVNAAAPANTVLADDTGADVAFTAEVPGTELTVAIEQATAGDITFAETTGPSVGTSLVRAFRGIALRPQDEDEVDANDDPVWAANAGVRIAQYGDVFVESSQTPATGGTVYVETASGANTGKLYTTSSATRVALPRSLAQWVRDGRSDSPTLAVVRLNVP